MKYIKQYIKKICPDVKIHSSAQYSNSEYWELNSYMRIRLSDHVTPVKSDSLILDIISNLEEEGKFFVFYKDSRIPLYRSRTDINALIKQMYEFTRIRDIAKQRIKASEGKKEYIEKREKIDEEDRMDWVISDKAKKTYHLILKKFPKCDDSISHLHHAISEVDVRLFCRFSKTVKSAIVPYFDKGIKGEDYIQLMISLVDKGYAKGSVTQVVNYADKVLKFIKERDKIV